MTSSKTIEPSASAVVSPPSFPGQNLEYVAKMKKARKDAAMTSNHQGARELGIEAPPPDKI